MGNPYAKEFVPMPRDAISAKCCQNGDGKQGSSGTWEPLHSAIGDFRTLPTDSWNKLYAAFAEEDSLNGSFAENVSDSSCSDDACSVRSFPYCAAITEKHMVAMLQLCQEEESMGPWSKMSKSNRDRVQQIRGE